MLFPSDQRYEIEWKSDNIFHFLSFRYFYLLKVQTFLLYTSATIQFGQKENGEIV